MSYLPTAEELKKWDITFWIESDICEFGRWDYKQELAYHTVQYTNAVRFHKPYLNATNPIEFIIQSAAKLLDGVRGPILHSKSFGADGDRNLIDGIRTQLISLRNDPEALLRTNILDTPLVRIRQAEKKFFVYEDYTGTQKCVVIKDEDAAIDELLELVRSSKVSGNFFFKPGEWKGAIDQLEQRLSESLPDESCELFRSHRVKVWYRDIKPSLGERVIKHSLHAYLSDGEERSIEISYDEDGALISSLAMKDFLDDAQSWVLPTQLERFIAATMPLKVGNMPAEDTCIFKNSHIELMYYRSVEYKNTSE